MQLYIDGKPNPFSPYVRARAKLTSVQEQEGFDADFRAVNPYPEGSERARLWNRGHEQYWDLVEHERARRA